ncbi:hypothetical protein KKC91_03720 [bacterium]|nr:hypothetical protein [bacterium]
MLLKVPLQKPTPDIETFCRIIRREIIPSRPPLVELIIDETIMKHLTEQLVGKKWVGHISGSKDSKEEQHIKCIMNFWYRFGYDYVRLSGGLDFSGRKRTAEDTSIISKGERNWTEEGKGIITNWEEFEKYPWPSLDKIDLWKYEFASQNLPDGMGLFVCPSSGILEIPLNALLGYETLAYGIYDQPDLIKAVFQRVGELIYGFYKKVIGLPNLYGFFQGDDMGFKTATLMPPDFLRKNVLPWHKKIASLAHENNLLYLLHACGNLEEIMNDLIEDVKIDGKHSFEDEIMPVSEFYKKYSAKIAILGGVDVDALCRLRGDRLRSYIRNILETCAPEGAYALGSGNSVANYVPPENYLIMLEEGLNW